MVAENVRTVRVCGREVSDFLSVVWKRSGPPFLRLLKDADRTSDAIALSLSLSDKLSFDGFCSIKFWY